VARGESERHIENLPKLIEEASALSLVGAKEQGVRVTFEFDPDAPFVLADRIQIQQVLLNPIRNAIEAMQDTERRELKVVTRSADEGHGVERGRYWARSGSGDCRTIVPPVRDHQEAWNCPPSALMRQIG
jgi:nitrogen-specific signal transduction histidine kinase